MWIVKIKQLAESIKKTNDSLSHIICMNVCKQIWWNMTSRELKRCLGENIRVNLLLNAKEKKKEQVKQM